MASGSRLRADAKPYKLVYGLKVAPSDLHVCRPTLSRLVTVRVSQRHRSHHRRILSLGLVIDSDPTSL
ncbi:hypothetical protein ACFX1X_008120 [Malus domestica]